MGERKKRHLTLDVFDYQENKVCTLCDSEMEVSGQAVEIYVNTQRNGWKELKFMIPSTLHTDSGEERNFRLDWLKAEYRIRMCDGTMQQDFTDGVDRGWQVDTTRPTEDWFLISEPKVQHKAFSQDYTVTAGHLCQLLKTRNLRLEFTDDEGNNVGRADEIADTILAGTGWELGYVHKFTEKRDPTKDKIRSIEAAAKTGAFKLLADMCEKFEAKPVYYTIRDTDGKLHRMVDILPMNPFEDEEQLLKNTGLVDNIIEMHYGKNVGGITRTLNTENMVTKLFAYGAYGDKTNGYCGIDEQGHLEYTLMPASKTPAVGDECKFTIGSDVYYFRCNTENIPSYMWSDLDPASKSYVSHVPIVNNEPDYDNIVVCEVYDKQKDSSDPIEFVFEENSTKVTQNWVSFVMDYNYYREVGLMTDEQLKAVAKYQRRIPALLEDVYNKSRTFNEKLNALSELIGSENFCKVCVESIEDDGGFQKITLDKSVYPTGLEYRSDYTTKDKKRFRWAEAPELKPNGEAVNTGASVVYIIHKPTENEETEDEEAEKPFPTWEKVYVKSIDNKDDPSSFTIWLSSNAPHYNAENGDVMLLFQSNNINGNLGALEIADDAMYQSINSTTKEQTVPHPVYFTDNHTSISFDSFEGYAWLWAYNPTSREESNSIEGDDYGLFYHDKSRSDVEWYKVALSKGKPAKETQTYCFDWQHNVLYRKNSDSYVALNDSTDEKRRGSLFASVLRAGQTRDKYYKGVYQKYNKTYSSSTPASVPAGNYAIDLGFGTYQLYTISAPIEMTQKIDEETQQPTGDYVVTLSYDTTTNWITPVDNVNSVIDTRAYGFNALKYHPENILAGLLWETGGVNDRGGDDDSASSKMRTSMAPCYGNTVYYMNGLENETVQAYFYNERRNFLIKETPTNPSGGTTYVFNASNVDARYMRIVINGNLSEKQLESISVYAQDREKYVIANNEPYKIEEGWEGDGDLKGILPYMEKLLTLPDDTYAKACKAMVEAQKVVTEEENKLTEALTDIIKEGYWQKDEYVDGDEDQLYYDAIDNIEKVAKPEATYNVDFSDLWGHKDEELEYGILDDTTKTAWTDLSIRSAAHLVDPEIDTNCWAFFDTINKCYDKPEKTKVAINTNLNVINQHSFTDVLSNIANVTSSIRGRTKVYERANSINKDGLLPTERLEGKISTNKLAIEGAASTTRTDDRGNLVFESGDGTKAMTLTGAGFAIANSKDASGNWDWRTFGTGDGFSADEIVAGYISADLIEAETVTANKLAADVGDTLTLSANKSIKLMFEDAKKDMESYVDGQTEVMRQAFVFDANTGLTIRAVGQDGATGNLATNFTNDRISFLDEGSTVAYISGSQLNISQAKLEQNMRIGDLQASVQNDGAIKWAWLGT